MEMNKIKLIIALTLLSVYSLAVTTYDSKSEYYGEWYQPASWKAGSAPTGTINGDRININGTVYSNTSITINNTTVSISNGDTLVICGDLVVGNGSELNISTGGVLVVLGNLDAQNNLDMNVSSVVIVQGNFTSQHGIGSDIAMIGGSSNLYVTGTNNLINSDFVSPSTVASIEDKSSLNREQPSLVSWLDSKFTSSALPISLSSFTVTETPTGILLSWTTESETDNDYFTVERSTDGINWYSIAVVEGAGTTSTKSNYSLVDDNVIDTVLYYRLYQTDNDDTYSYSSIVTYNGDRLLDNTVRVNYNPISQHININGDMQYVFIYMSGVLVLSTTNCVINISDLPDGLYIIVVFTKDGSKYTHKIVKI